MPSKRSGALGRTKDGVRNLDSAAGSARLGVLEKANKEMLINEPGPVEADEARNGNGMMTWWHATRQRGMSNDGYGYVARDRLPKRLVGLSTR